MLGVKGCMKNEHVQHHTLCGQIRHKDLLPYIDDGRATHVLLYALLFDSRIVVDKLKGSVSAPVTVALDGWTNTRHDKVINIIPICKGVIAYKEKLRTKQLTTNLVVNTDNGKQYSRWDARSVWNLYLPTATELAACALALLSITASEAAVERSFSMQGIVHSDRRNRLLNSSVQDEMFIKFNHRALGKTADTGGCVFELNEEYEAEYTTTAFNSDIYHITPQAEADPNLADAAVALILHSDSEQKQDNNNACEPETIPVDTVAAFITQYIRDHHITASYKWNSDKLNALESAAITNRIADRSAVLREKIKSQVTPPPRSTV